MKTVHKIAVMAMMGMSLGIKVQAQAITDTGDKVGIGTTTPQTKLDVNGIIQVGEKKATDGGIIIAQKYNDNNYIGTLSSNYSSGALIMGYGAAGMPNQGVGQLVSTFDNWNGFRSAIRVASGTFEFVSSPTKLQTTVGEQINVESRFFINNQGKVGIGTTNPSAKLDVNGIITSRNEIRSLSVNPGFLFDESDVIDKNWHIQVNGGNLKFYEVNDARSIWSQKMFIESGSGKVGIGTTTTGNHKLAVEGSIGAREIKVEAGTWSDFVFYDDYQLPTLTEVENHIKEKGHLKDIPSAKEVKKNGFFLGAMDAKLLQKIEELTLYTIQQEKKIKVLEKQNTKLEEQEKKIERLEILVEKLLKEKK
ncbi:exported hypothetical protein [Tenacibaculum sediminilitoris]|uniref:hypothetical protein n=1 Tax=Tenacibaculum sediminilitoris TaxID=1820334 RepID=UPI003895A43F